VGGVQIPSAAVLSTIYDFDQAAETEIKRQSAQ
jgi:hypothetical protein